MGALHIICSAQTSRSFCASLFFKIVSVSAFLFSGNVAFADICGISGDEPRSQTDTFLRDMKIASVRGDIVQMQSSFEAFYSDELANCEPLELLQVCGFDCHMQIGQYRLFMASDLAFYSSEGGSGTSTEPILPENLNEQATIGIEFLEKQRSKLLGELPAEGAQTTAPLRNYLVQLANYDLLRARLLMARGDVHYQSISEARLKKVLHDVADATDGATARNRGLDVDHDIVETNYKEALWTVAEATMGMPKNQPFDDIRVDYIELQHDLSERLRSVSEGNLFIGINPDEFSPFTIDKLRVELRDIQDRVRLIEGKVEQLLQSWLNAKGVQAAQNVDEERFQANRSANLSMYRIGQLEDMSAAFNNEIGEKRQVLKDETRALEFQQGVARLEADLQSKMLELNHRRESIEARREIEVLDLAKEQTLREISDIRWLMNWKISKTNLEIQVSSYESQLTQYKREQVRIENEKRQIALRVAALEIEMQNSDEAILQSSERITVLENRAGDIWAEQEKSFIARICQLESEIAFLGANPTKPLVEPVSCPAITVSYDRDQYLGAMCGGEDQDNGLRKQIADAGINKLAMVLKCVIGEASLPDGVMEILDDEPGACPASFAPDATRIEMAKKIFEKEQAFAEQQFIDLGEQVREMQAQLRKVDSDFATSIRSQKNFSNSMTALGTAMTIASQLPKKGAVAGAGGGPLFFLDEYPAVASAYNTYRDYEQSNLSIKEFERSRGQAITSMQSAISRLKDKLDLEPLHNELRRIHAAKAMQEIRGQALQMEQQLREQVLRARSVVVECQGDRSKWEHNVSTALLRHDQLIAEMIIAQATNELIAQDVNIENSRIRQQENVREIADLRVQELGVKVEGLETELGLVRELVGLVEIRKGKILGLNGELTSLEREETAQRAALEDLSKLYETKTLALSDAEKRHVEAVIVQERSQTERLLDGITSLEGVYGQDSDLVKNLQAFQGDISSRIAQERDNLINRTLAQDDAGEKEQIFVATQEQIATFIKGVPTYLRNKRRLLERGNMMLNLLRSRVGALTSLTRTGESELDLVFVRTGDDLERMARLTSDKARWSREQVITEMSRIVIPRDSGLARTLSAKSSSYFEITPYARGRSEQLGHFAIWSRDFDPDRFGMTQNLMLIDFMVGVFFPMPACHERRYALIHRGAGFTFKEASGDDPTMLPALKVGASRVSTATYLSLADFGEERLRPIQQFWARNHYLHNFLREGMGPPNDINANMPLMGAPLIGSYELNLPLAPEGCDYEDASYIFYPVYAKSARPLN